jgi:acetyl/propionyl-CoA carboxylase alpha subunit
MNTRLQVEHPVTEEVFGLDLVEWQLRVAMGERLPTNFETLVPRGHSIEARIYAEDVDKNFFPAPGPVFGFLPATGPGIRWEIGIDTVDVVTSKFDPMVAKLIATGPDRPAAIARLAQALSQTFFAASASNREFLIDICSATDFRFEAVGTHFIETQSKAITQSKLGRRGPFEGLGEELLNAVAERGGGLAKAHTKSQHHNITALSFGSSSDSQHAHSVDSGIAFGPVAVWKLPGAGGLTCRLGSGTIKNDGAVHHFVFSTGHGDGKTSVTVAVAGRQFQRTIEDKAEWQGKSGGIDHAHDIVAPVPGKVIKVKVQLGTPIEQGTSIFILESMKMEFEVKARKAGSLARILVNEGDQVATGDALAVWVEDSVTK